MASPAPDAAPAAAAKRRAPWLPVPAQPVISVEHPCIIKNLDKGIASLGGDVRLGQFLDSQNSTKTIAVSLRPDDRLAKPMPSVSAKTENLLLKLTVPKLTGRKRKKGSSGPFLPPSENGIDQTPQSQPVGAKRVRRSLEANASKYTVEIVGHLSETHRFRSLPDFQYAASRNHLMQKLRDSFLPLDPAKLQAATFDHSKLNLLPDIGPPARFSQSGIPFNYSYQQNRAITYAKDATGSGDVHVVAPQRRIPVNNLIIPTDAYSVPFETTLPTVPEDELDRDHQEFIALIRQQFEKRPIISRHVLYNTLGWGNRDKIRLAVSYCAYRFKSGPWKDAVIKLGIDPRTDPKYRHYQTIMFQPFRNEEYKHWKYLSRETSSEALERISRGHIFDGKNYVQTGHVFQVCDFTDPALRRLLDTPDIRTTCSTHNHGWYHAGTWAKARIVAREKGNIILDGEEADDQLFKRILNLPEHITTATVQELRDREKEEGRPISRRELKLIMSVRDLAYVPDRMEHIIRPKASKEETENSRRDIGALDGSPESAELSSTEELNDSQNGEGSEIDEYDEYDEAEGSGEESSEISGSGSLDVGSGSLEDITDEERSESDNGAVDA
ncbi:uncharacterized protein BDZ99DRAFT_458430 [Mytilinidion resinicola]|uniref:RNA polymerase III transcription factor IIIC subunit-domain-containing protein n=1 Tax=Mytilinidion resinicola TaxID=574789 RepID=A0A6A6Z8G3_9PEZI|nr:uncharacterized protein BDZ99DRAFT_458430 [Mytilinidion resinicola]KAF2816575.1 hypothetical protein BDZ99DRAFT_458430 [Mytilinidion resinicola]